MPDTISPQLVRLFPLWHPTLGLGLGLLQPAKSLTMFDWQISTPDSFCHPFPFGTACCSLSACQTLRAHGETSRSSHCEGRFTCWTRQALIKSAQKVHGKRNCLTINVYHVEISRFLFNVAKCLPSLALSPLRLSVGAV